MTTSVNRATRVLKKIEFAFPIPSCLKFSDWSQLRHAVQVHGLTQRQVANQQGKNTSQPSSLKTAPELAYLTTSTIAYLVASCQEIFVVSKIKAGGLDVPFSAEEELASYRLGSALISGRYIHRKRSRSSRCSRWSRSRCCRSRESFWLSWWWTKRCLKKIDCSVDMRLSMRRRRRKRAERGRSGLPLYPEMDSGGGGWLSVRTRLWGQVSQSGLCFFFTVSKRRGQCWTCFCVSKRQFWFVGRWSKLNSFFWECLSGGQCGAKMPLLYGWGYLERKKKSNGIARAS